MGMDLLSTVLIPSVCFSVIAAFQVFEFNTSLGRARGLFHDVRAGWVDENYLKGQQAVNTTRDYIRIALFFGNTSIIIAGFAAGFAATQYSTCEGSDNGCSDYDTLLFVKIGFLVGVLLCIFFIFTQCSRFMNHFSFMINTREVNGVALPKELVVRVFHHSHLYYSIGIRMYFLVIPLFSWIFTEWCLLGVTPIYLWLIHGLESSNFMSKELNLFEASVERTKNEQSNRCTPQVGTV